MYLNYQCQACGKIALRLTPLRILTLVAVMKQRILLHIKNVALRKKMRLLLAELPLIDNELHLDCIWIESIDAAANYHADCLILDTLDANWAPDHDAATRHKPPTIYLADTDDLSEDLSREKRIESILPVAYLNVALLEKHLTASIRTAALKQQIIYLQNHDALTGLASQHLLQEQLGFALHKAAQNNHKLALMAISIDQLDEISSRDEQVNKSAILRAVAQRLVITLRRKDLLARTEKDLFLVIVEDVTHASDIGRTAFELLKSMQRPFEVEEAGLSLTVSIGVALFPDSGNDVPALLGAAHVALSLAAAAGNDFRIFDVEAANISNRHFEIEQALPGALTRREFEVVYQPQLELETGRITGAEALLRWYRPSLGEVPPEAFIPIAEETECILDIGEWTLRESLATAEKWHARSHQPIKLAVNVSGKQFRNQKILSDVESLLEKTGLPNQCLELEITERVFIQNIKSHREVFSRLKSLGVRIALDDFGIGYSSLSYLKHFSVDSLKIDRSFVAALPDSKDDAAIVRAIIALSHSLNIRVIAEGIENEAQLEFLHEHQCDEVQGHLYSLPLPAQQFMRMLEAPDSTEQKAQKAVGQS